MISAKYIRQLSITLFLSITAILWFPTYSRCECLQGDCFSTQSVMIFPDGGKYEGDFKNGLRHGYGLMAFNTSDRYKGDWKNGVPDGNGSLFYNEGEYYEGEFKNGLRHGTGTITSPTDNRYTGEWQQDLPHGNGTITYKSGSSFEGSFVNGQRHGQGIFHDINGKRYAVTFDNNIKKEIYEIDGAALSTNDTKYISIRPHMVNIRKGPSTDYPVLFKANKGYPLQLLDKKGTWLQVKNHQEKTGWISEGLIAPLQTEIITKNSAQLRNGPSTNNRVIAILPYGSVAEFLETQGDWYRLRFKSYEEGWIFRDNIWPPREK